MKSLFIYVDKDGWTDRIQVAIGDGLTGYRLAGPKYNGSSIELVKQRLTKRDIEEIKQFLEASEQD